MNKGKAYRAAGITIELRDTGEHGFLLPADQVYIPVYIYIYVILIHCLSICLQIIPTGEENVQAILVFAEQLNAKPIPGL